MRGALAGLLPPEPFDQEVAGDDLVRVDEEQRQERTLLRPAQVEQAVVGLDLERPKNPELHPLAASWQRTDATTPDSA